MQLAGPLRPTRSATTGDGSRLRAASSSVSSIVVFRLCIPPRRPPPCVSKDGLSMCWESPVPLEASSGLVGLRRCFSSDGRAPARGAHVRWGMKEAKPQCGDGRQEL